MGFACEQGLLDRLQSDTTRLAAVKAFGRIAESPLPLDMAPVLDRLLTDLASFLRKSNRPLRQAALAAIEVCNLFLWLSCIARLKQARPKQLVQSVAAYAAKLCYLLPEATSTFST